MLRDRKTVTYERVGAWCQDRHGLSQWKLIQLGLQKINAMEVKWLQLLTNHLL